MEDPAYPYALPTGCRLHWYVLERVLGQGGFGITYRARDAQLGRDVAVKEYLPSALAVRQDGVTVLPRTTKMADDFTWGRDRFVAEGRTLASLEHAPAIVPVFDFLEANGTAYIVMKLVPGDTLENRIKQGPLSPAEIDRIFQKMVAKKPEDRYQQAFKLVAELEAWISPHAARGASTSLPSDSHLSDYLKSRPQFAGVKSNVLEGDAASQIASFATEAHADLIVMPSHGYHGVKRFLLGSVTEAVLRHAPCEVLVLRRVD